MDTQVDRLHHRPWDHLLVLDACRYDTFRSVHPDVSLIGSLDRVTSPASCTINWLKETFSGYHEDIVYVSATPYVNSRGITREGWTAVQHFHDIVDVWDDGWDEGLGTVPPGAVTDAALRTRQRHPEKRLVIHYLQPHAPYLGLDEQRSLRTARYREKKVPDVLKTLYRSLGPPVLKLVGMDAVFGIRKALGLTPVHDGEQYWRQLSLEAWREAYADNLRHVLDEARRYLTQVEGRAVLTADHGEALGEDGLYMHPMGVDHPVLREVPWFEVDDVPTAD